MTHTTVPSRPPRPTPLSNSWPQPSTIITHIQPTQYFPQGPIGR